MVLIPKKTGISDKQCAGLVGGNKNAFYFASLNKDFTRVLAYTAYSTYNITIKKEMLQN